MRAAASILCLLGLLASSPPAPPARAERTWDHHRTPTICERAFTYAIDGIHRQGYRFGGPIGGGLSGELKRQDLDDPDLTLEAYRPCADND